MAELPPLSSLLAFEAVHRTGSVTAAAVRLGRTHGAVSKQLHQLQDHAGIDLFRKKGTGLELTADGLRLAGTVARAFEDIRNGWASLRPAEERLTVTIAASATFARAWLIPTLSRFNRDFPDIDVLIRLVGPTGTRSLDPVPDLVMSWDRLLAPLGMEPSVVSLGDVRIGPVVSPDHPHAMSPLGLFCDTRIDRSGAETAWTAWSDLTGIAFDCRRSVAYDHSYLAFEAARSGMGAVMAPAFLIADELASGALVAPAGFVTFANGFYVRPTAPHRMPRNAVILLDWLQRHARLDG